MTRREIPASALAPVAGQGYNTRMLADRLKQIAADAAHMYGAQMLGLVVGFGVSILVARTLGPDGRGAYGWIMGLYFIAIQIGQLGTDTLNRRLAATQPELAPTLAANSLAQALTLGSVAALGLAIFGLFQPVGQAYPWALMLGLAVTPLAILHGVWASIAVGLGHVKIAASTEIIQRLALAGTLLLLLLTVQLDVWHLLAVQMASMLAAASWVGWNLYRLIGHAWHINLSLFQREKNLLMGALAAGVFTQLLQKIDVLMLGMWRPLAESGYYTIALTLLDAMVMLPGAIAMVLMPRLAADTDERHRWHTLLVVLGVVMAGFGVACMAMHLLAPWLIPFLFGASFGDAVPIFQRLLVGIWLWAGFLVCQQAVTGYGRARYVLLAPLVGVIIKTGFGWIYVPHGALAAANGNVAAYGAALVTALVLARWGALTKEPQR